LADAIISRREFRTEVALGRNSNWRGAATALSSVSASIKMPEGLLQSSDMALYKAK